MIKNKLTIKEAAEDVLRSYLVRCFKEVSKQYPKVQSMNPEDGADELLRLRRNNEIIIELKTIGNIIKCNINHVN